MRHPMAVPPFIRRQLGHPSGLLGAFVARMLNKSNAWMNRAAVDAAALTPGDRVLDVGFGGGVALPMLLDAVGPEGRVAALERARDMVAAARRGHRDAVASGRLELVEGSVESVPWGNGAFDAVITINTVYFWPRPAEGIREIRRVLAPGGRVVVGVRPRGLQERGGFGVADAAIVGPEDARRLVEAAGFVDVDVTTESRGIGHALVTARAPS